MKFIAIIPARYASTRFPGKPLADIQGKPMIQHVYERTSQVFEHCCVATDDTRIAEAVDRFGGCAVMTSPDHRSGTDRCAEALDKYSKTTGTAFDAVINVQGDEPFISTEHLTSLRDALDVPGAEIATLAYPMKPGDDIFNPNTPKITLSRDGYASTSAAASSLISAVRNSPNGRRATRISNISAFTVTGATSCTR